VVFQWHDRSEARRRMVTNRGSRPPFSCMIITSIPALFVVPNPRRPGFIG
jgi:hypothetical protein